MGSSWRTARVLRAALFLVLTAPTASRAVTYVVTSTGDATLGGTLREKILAANAAGVPAEIDFNITGGCPTVCTIQPGTPLPAITVPLTIDGYTQPGASPNGLAIGNNAVHKIVLDFNGVTFSNLSFSSTAANSIVRGLVLGNFGNGAFVGGGIDISAGGVAVEGNFLGVDASGSVPAYYGANVGIAASNVRVGGPLPAQRNVFGNSVAAISISSGVGTVIQGNYIGTNAAGTASIPCQYGIMVNPQTSAGAITIGGTGAGEGNVISGNVGQAIRIFAGNLPPPATVGAVTIQGNLIGLDATGNTAIPNFEGIYLFNAGNMGPVLVGGTAAGAGNVIAGNGDAIHSLGATGLTVQGNRIGTNAAGTSVLGNLQWGIDLDGDFAFAGSTQIGGTAAGAGNVIAGGSHGGIRVLLTSATIEGNFIGVGSDGTTPLINSGVGILVDSGDAAIGGTSVAQHNVIAFNTLDGVQVDISQSGIRNAAKATVLGNSVFSNGGFGIYFVGSGSTPWPNDPGDGDAGPNGLQNYPVLTAASLSSGLAFVSGTLDSMPNTVYRIEWFANTACDPSGNGEGRLFLGGGDYSTDGSGHVAFNGVMFPIPPGYPIITATATDPAGNTSEFSPCFTATGPNTNYYTVAPCRLADTRDPAGPYGGPALGPNAFRGFVVGGQCGVPVGAISVALNVAVTGPTDPGNLIVYPAGAATPVVSTVNYGVGRARSNNAIIPLGPNGAIVVFANQSNGTVQVIIDVTGYFQ